FTFRQHGPHRGVPAGPPRAWICRREKHCGGKPVSNRVVINPMNGQSPTDRLHCLHCFHVASLNAIYGKLCIESLHSPHTEPFVRVGRYSPNLMITREGSTPESRARPNRQAHLKPRFRTSKRGPGACFF